MITRAFDLKMPETRESSVVFASPHSGRDYVGNFLDLTILDESTIRSSEDAFVDILFEDAPEFGVPLLLANAPRAYVDLNRSADELDPALVEGVVRSVPNPRINSGLGVVPRVVANGRAIYSGKIPLADAERRIAMVWQPYHDMLEQLLDESREMHGACVLVDLHSMPREAVDMSTRNGGRRPEVVLGDRFGVAAGSDVMEAVEAAFLDAGLHVVRNAPFAGAYTAQHYGRPLRGQHVIQVEIDRSLYMDEAKVRPNQDFPAFKELMRQVTSKISTIGRAEVSLAAE